MIFLGAWTLRTQQVQQSDHFLAAVYLEHSVRKDCYSLRSCLRVSDFWIVCHVTCKWEANHQKPNWNRDGEHVHVQHWQVISAGHDRNASVREVEADVIRKKGRSKLCHCVNQIYTIYILLYPYNIDISNRMQQPILYSRWTSLGRSRSIDLAGILHCIWNILKLVLLQISQIFIARRKHPLSKRCASWHLLCRCS